MKKEWKKPSLEIIDISIYTRNSQNQAGIDGCIGDNCTPVGIGS